MRNSKRTPQFDMGTVQMAAMQARSFHHNALSMVTGEIDTKDPREAFGTDPAAFSVFASNLIFAVELYFKTFIVGTNTQPPETHNIWSLFNKLSNVTQNTVEREFISELAKFKNANSFHLVISKRKEIDQSELLNIINSEKKVAPKGDFNDLRKVLRDTGDSYMFWRYMFSKVPTDSTDKVVRLHWHHLISICRACEQILNSMITARLKAIQEELRSEA